MTQVNDLIEYARAQGVAFYQGKIATGSTFDSARVQAIVPAIQAIEVKDVALTSDLPGAITRAYADGARITYTADSLKTAVSKTAQFLIAADKGLALSAIHYVECVIRDTNDSDTQNIMRKRAFENLTDVCRLANKIGAVPSRDEVVAILNPQKPDPTKNEKLEKLFAKLGKLAKEVATTDMNKYSAMAVEGLRYERLAGEHKALAAREAEHAKPEKAPAAPVETVTPQSDEPVETVTPQSNVVVETTEQDDVDMILAA